MQNIVIKHFYISLFARYNQDIQETRILTLKEWQKPERIDIMLLLLLMLSDWLEIQRIDQELERIRTDEWWK